jgi:hypothetical protein
LDFLSSRVSISEQRSAARNQRAGVRRPRIRVGRRQLLDDTIHTLASNIHVEMLSNRDINYAQETLITSLEFALIKNLHSDY